MFSRKTSLCCPVFQRYLEETHEYRRNALKLESFEQIQAAVQLAEEQRSQGNLFAAYDAYLTILTDRLSAQLIAADMVVIHSLADLAIFFGQVEAADDLFAGAVGHYQFAKNLHMADYTTLQRIHLAIDRGQLQHVKKLFGDMQSRIGELRQIQFSEPGLATWEANCHWIEAESNDRTVLFAQLHLAMGRSLTAMGQYRDALATLNRGLGHVGETAPVLAQAAAMPLKLAIATAQLEAGHLAATRTSLNNLQPDLDVQQYPEFYIRWLEISGKLNLLQGRFGQALEQFRQIQERCHQLGAKQIALQSTLNLAHILILLNQTTVAEEQLAAIQPDLTTATPSLAKRASLLLQLAQSRSQSLVAGSPGLSVSGMRQSGQSPIPESASQAPPLPTTAQRSASYLALFEDWVLGVHWQLGCLDLVGAIERFEQINQVFSHSDSKLIQIRIQILHGILAYYQGVEAEAESETSPTHPSQMALSQETIRLADSLLDQVRPFLRQMELKPELWQVQRLLGWCRSRLQYSRDEQDALAQDTNALLEDLTQSLSPEDQTIYLLNKWTADEEYIAAATNQLQRRQAIWFKSSPWLRPWHRWGLMNQLHALMEHIDHYKDALAKRTIQGRNVADSNSRFALWQRLIKHPRNRLTLSFLVLPDRVLVVRSSWLWLDFRVVPVTRLAVRNLVQQWYGHIQNISGGRDLSATSEEEIDQSIPADTVIKDIANRLSELLELPSLLNDLPRHIRSLTIVPDDILHGFPFAAIVHRGKYLIERYALTVHYDSRGYESRRRLSPPAEAPTAKALVVGVYDGNNQFPPLPKVRDELDQVHRWLTQHQIDSFTLENRSACKAAVVDSLSQVTLLHMACHGTFELNQPDRSGLVLLSESGQKEILSLRDLSELDLSALHHATLSCCWSADSFVLPGRWIISLPETLWRSNTQSILGSLWEVYDQFAVAFMTQFYVYLDQLPRDEALRQTQLDCLNQRLPHCASLNASNPLFWAGFTLYGNSSKLQLTHRQQ
jgi:hypothetical protein